MWDPAPKGRPGRAGDTAGGGPAGAARVVLPAAWTAVVLCVLVLAISLPGLRLVPGTGLRPAPLGGGSAAPATTGVSMAPILAIGLRLALVLLPVVILAHLFSREGRRRLLLDLGIFAVLLLILIVATRALPQGSGKGSWQDPSSLGDRSESAPAPGWPVFEYHPAPWTTVVVVTALSLAAAVGLVFAARALVLRRRRPPSAPGDIASAAERALGSLARGADVRDVVIRCYAEMGRHVAESRGLRREHHVTAAEFCETLLQAGLPAGAVRTLTALFEDVRYGGVGSDEDRQSRAQSALTEIVSSRRSGS